MEVAAALTVAQYILQLAAVASEANRPITSEEWATVNDRIAAADSRLDNPPKQA